MSKRHAVIRFKSSEAGFQLTQTIDVLAGEVERTKRILTNTGFIITSVVYRQEKIMKTMTIIPSAGLNADGFSIIIDSSNGILTCRE